MLAVSTVSHCKLTITMCIISQNLYGNIHIPCLRSDKRSYHHLLVPFLTICIGLYIWRPQWRTRDYVITNIKYLDNLYMLLSISGPTSAYCLPLNANLTDTGRRRISIPRIQLQICYSLNGRDCLPSPASSAADRYCRGRIVHP